MQDVQNVVTLLAMEKRCTCKVGLELKRKILLSVSSVKIMVKWHFQIAGGAIWHPKCGPGPTENGTIINGLGSDSHIALNGHLTDTDREFDRFSSSAASETQVCVTN